MILIPFIFRIFFPMLIEIVFGFEIAKVGISVGEFVEIDSLFAVGERVGVGVFKFKPFGKL
jgi:hypothetical protein